MICSQAEKKNRTEQKLKTKWEKKNLEMRTDRQSVSFNSRQFRIENERLKTQT